jgi:hypothetical protein
VLFPGELLDIGGIVAEPVDHAGERLGAGPQRRQVLLGGGDSRWIARIPSMPLMVPLASATAATAPAATTTSRRRLTD